MEIYIGNIPKGTRPSELKMLLKESIRPNIFQRLYEKIISLGRLDDDIKVEIYTSKGKNKRRPYRYGQITIKSDRVAPVALEALHNTSIRGNMLNVRKFVARKVTNERRAVVTPDVLRRSKTRRKKERRKHQL